MPNAHGEELLGPFIDYFDRRHEFMLNKERKKVKRRVMNLDRYEWYLREHGRPPSYDEIVALRDKDVS